MPSAQKVIDFHDYLGKAVVSETFINTWSIY
jgi:hypothetical protein